MEYTTGAGLAGKGSSTCLAGMIEKVIRESGVEPTALTAITLSNGPGTFTGLRVGVVTARMLAWSLKIPLFVVNSLEATANSLRLARELPPGQRIWSAVNAQRTQLFVAGFRATAEGVEAFHDQELVAREAFLEMIQAGDHVTGPGAQLVAETVESRSGISLPTVEAARCSALAVLKLALPRIQAGDHDDLWTIEPIYFRPSAAEEVRLATGLQDSE